MGNWSQAGALAPDAKASMASLAAALAQFFEIDASVLTLAGQRSGSISNGEAGGARGQSKKRESMRRAERQRESAHPTVGVTVPLIENRKVRCENWESYLDEILDRGDARC